jgi:hypothetical protein
MDNKIKTKKYRNVGTLKKTVESGKMDNTKIYLYCSLSRLVQESVNIHFIASFFVFSNGGIKI